MVLGTVDGRTRRRPGVGVDSAHDERARGRDLGRRSRSIGVDRLDRALVGVRNHRLLTTRLGAHTLLRMRVHRSESGSALIESTFALVLLMFLVLGTIEVAFALYGRNVVLNAAHQAARTAVEVGR